ncbi:MAG: hypothetical protein ACKO5A_08145 [Actinomycetota bacterium]
MNVWNRIPEWMIVLPAVVVWVAAVVDVVRDRTVGPDTRLVWGIFLVLAAPLAPLRFLLRRKVTEPRPTAIDPPREAYIDRIEALGPG